MKLGKGRIIKIFVIAVLAVLFVVLAAEVYLFVRDTRLDSITVEGNSHYSDQEVLELLFPEAEDRRTVKVWFNEQFGEHLTIPYITSYEITLTGLHSAEIMVYEKSVVACLEYMGSFVYFDKDGIVVETAQEKTMDVPVITGIVFSRIVMHQPIAVENEQVFTTVLNLTQLLTQYGMDVDKVYYNDVLEAKLYMGDIRVMLGSNQYLAEKILELKSILPQLEGRAGTLYLDSYDPDAVKPQYRFKPEKN